MSGNITDSISPNANIIEELVENDVSGQKLSKILRSFTQQEQQSMAAGRIESVLMSAHRPDFQGFDRHQIYEAIGRHRAEPVIDLSVVSEHFMRPEFCVDYGRLGFIPLPSSVLDPAKPRRQRRIRQVVACTSSTDQDVRAQILTSIEKHTGLRGADVTFALAPPHEINAKIMDKFRDFLSNKAINELADKDPVMSARTVITLGQMVALFVIFSLMMLGFACHGVATLLALNIIFTLFYLGSFVFRLILTWKGGRRSEEMDGKIAALAKAIPDDELPTITVLVPMFKEPDILPIITTAIRNLDYPREKMDIKIVLEEDDKETIASAEKLNLEGIFEIIKVPLSKPQTKPKACNYALTFARHELLVIFDAEDRPERDQMRKVAAAFRLLPENTACIQCRLNYFNPDENWLTRMFTLDYSSWFDLVLPGLEAMSVPVPLGGTSNYFKIDVLRELYAWDAFNVTEDADLGIRLTQKGYRVGVIDSTTYEEANCHYGNWIRQRSRWIKGYMQTFLVHLRRPVHLVRSIGLHGFAGFVFFIGGVILAGLINPLFWVMFAFWAVTGTQAFEKIFPPFVLYFSLFNMVAGNALFIYLTMLAPFRRRLMHLVVLAPSVIGYWILMSIAAYKALWQLIWNPFFWEKTTHGLSKQTSGFIMPIEATIPLKSREVA